MNGYRACCVEGSVDGYESVDELDSEAEDVLDSAQAMRAGNKRKHEREVEENLTQYCMQKSIAFVNHPQFESVSHTTAY